MSRGGLALPKLARIDHSKNLTERERIAQSVSVEDTHARLSEMKFGNFSFS